MQTSNRNSSVFQKLKKARELPSFSKQLIKFTLIGMLAVLTDLICYKIFLSVFPEKVLLFINNEDFAKTLSFICGLFVTYNLNKHWTWKQKEGSNKRFAKFIALYLASLIINVTINAFLLKMLHEFGETIPYKYLIAFIGATGVSSVVNFIGQKTWVFRVKPVIAG